jgi:hypothetical protein
LIEGEKITLYRTLSEIERLIREFEACTLPGGDWTHHAHLVLAVWYLAHYAGAEAEQRIRHGIQQYNAARGVLVTKDSGYHEPITMFWIRMARRYLAAAHADRSIEELVNGMIASCGDKDLPLTCYSRERLMSWEARLGWVEPDIKPLDE